MPKGLVTSILVLFLASTAVAGKKKSEPDPVMTDVTARGRALYEYDQAAWYATDAVQAMHPPDESVGRYSHSSQTRDGRLRLVISMTGATDF